VIFLRLCSRAPTTRMTLWDIGLFVLFSLVDLFVLNPETEL